MNVSSDRATSLEHGSKPGVFRVLLEWAGKSAGSIELPTSKLLLCDEVTAAAWSTCCILLRIHPGEWKSWVSDQLARLGLTIAEARSQEREAFNNERKQYAPKHERSSSSRQRPRTHARA